MFLKPARFTLILLALLPAATPLLAATTNTLPLAPPPSAATKTPSPPSAAQIIPTAKKPFNVPADPAEKKTLVKEIEKYMALPPAQVTAHPAAEDFPGAAPGGSPRVTRTIQISAAKDRWQSTGLYANPGEIVTVTHESALPEDVAMEVRIGCHTDRLFGEKITQWKRFPQITRAFTLTTGTTPVANAFGGPIFVNARHSIKLHKAAQKSRPTALTSNTASLDFNLKFSNAVEAPFYALGKTTAAEWRTRRDAPAPWAELAGRNMILHFPSAQIRKMDDPAPLLDWWDKVVAAQDSLVAWPARATQERVVPDRQIGGGWMHSGYPFMCHLASAPMITNLEKLRTEGDWGFFHELGHNHQSPAWTFPGQGEVTVNFFSLYCMEHLSGKPTGRGHPALDGDKLWKALDHRFATPPSEDPFDQLAPFVVLLRQYGWEPLQKTLASYQTAPAAPKSSVEERQTDFIRRYSRNASADLSAYFARMGYACAPSLKDELKSLPAFDYTAWRRENNTTTTTLSATPTESKATPKHR